MSTSYLVLDIETVLDAELPIVQAVEAERLPAPPHHKVVVIGALMFDSAYEVKRIGIFSEGKDEAGTRHGRTNRPIQLPRPPSSSAPCTNSCRARPTVRTRSWCPLGRSTADRTRT